ncbi:MAG: PIG-L deacetylase family protein [Nanoarchaeota archaeon]
MRKAKSILVICAHSDDQIFGTGGTMAKYAKEGWDVYTVVFSFGEMSHPHFKPRIIRKMRIDESMKANKIIGGKSVMFLGLHEGRFLQDFEERGKKKLDHILNLCKPEKIFTHTGDDPHADHRMVHRIVLDTYDRLKMNANVYTFNVWNLFNIKSHDTPKLVVDISDTFKKKVAALKAFRSQINFFSYIVLNNILYVSIFIRAFLNGLSHNCRFAEVYWIER